jgi:riboflavin biosynthesis pyrimidine reductase
VERLDFPSVGRPYLVANFVETVDGKVQGPGAGYWPIGSEADFELLLDVRAQCDALVHGRQTALAFDHVQRLASEPFARRLKEAGRTDHYTYVVLSAHPDEALLSHIDPASAPLRVVLVTTEAAKLPSAPAGVEIWRCGDGPEIDLAAFRVRAGKENLGRLTLEAGPRLFGAFVQARLVDELLVTIAPKLFGTAFGTPTMINGVLFEPDTVPALELVSVRGANNEIFARYRFKEVAK